MSVSGETINVFSPELTQHLACSQILVSASGALQRKVGSGMQVESHVLESVLLICLFTVTPSYIKFLFFI